MHATLAAVVLTVSPAGGVLLLFLSLLLGFSARGQDIVKGVGNAAAASFMGTSVIMLFQEFAGDELFEPVFSPIARLSGSPSVSAEEELSFQKARTALAMLAIGTVLSVKVIHWVTKTSSSKSMVVAAVMFLHTAAEGAAIGLAADRSVYGSILFSLAVHNVPEGFVVAVASQKEMGWLKCTLLVIFSHLPQPITMFLFAQSAEDPTSIFKLPLAAEWMLQGLSLGSIAATCWFELVPEAVEDLGGKVKAYTVMGVMCAAMYMYL